MPATCAAWITRTAATRPAPASSEPLVAAHISRSVPNESLKPWWSTLTSGAIEYASVSKMPLDTSPSSGLVGVGTRKPNVFAVERN